MNDPAKRQAIDHSDMLAEAWLLLDDESDEQGRALLAQHLTECSACHRDHELVNMLKNLVPGAYDRPSDSARNWLRQQIRVAVLDRAEVTVEAGPEGGITTNVEVRSRGQQAHEREAISVASVERVEPARWALRLLDRGVRVLPAQHRARYREEFDAELCDLAESGASRRKQVTHCLRLHLRAWSLRRALLAPPPAQEQVR